MIVCVCNRLNEARIRTAIQGGRASSSEDVYGLCGVRKNCGRCQETIAEMMAAEADKRVLVAAE